MAEEGQLPKIPMNQEALLSSSSDSSDEEDDDLVVHTRNKNHGAPLDSDVASTATETESSFKNWFEDDRHVPPDDKIPYLMMMMTTLDDTFTLDAPPFNKEKKKKGLKPTFAMYRKELHWRDPTITKSRLTHMKTDVILSLMRDTNRLADQADISFVRTQVDEYTAKLTAKHSSTSTTTTTRSASRKIDRMRIVECMILDTVKPCISR